MIITNFISAHATIRLEILHQSPLPECVSSIATMKDEIFMLCDPQLKGGCINVYDRNNNYGSSEECHTATRITPAQHSCLQLVKLPLHIKQSEIIMNTQSGALLELTNTGLLQH